MIGGQQFYEFYLIDIEGQLPPPESELLITEDGDQIMTEDNINIITE
jgi:hypothetical protein